MISIINIAIYNFNTKRAFLHIKAFSLSKKILKKILILIYIAKLSPKTLCFAIVAEHGQV